MSFKVQNNNKYVKVIKTKSDFLNIKSDFCEKGIKC